MGTEIPGIQLHESQATEEALGAESGGTVQERVRELTSRTWGISLIRMVHDLAEYLRGWIGYFGRCETPEVLAKLEKWLRHRLRSMVWKQWKRGTTRYRELRQRGIAAQDAAKTAGRLRWTVAPCEHASAENRSLQRLLRLARASRAHGSWLVQPAEPPDADPHVRSCGRGEWATTPPMPIQCSQDKANFGRRRRVPICVI
jgi:hypothetical protein